MPQIINKKGLALKVNEPRSKVIVESNADKENMTIYKKEILPALRSLKEIRFKEFIEENYFSVRNQGPNSEHVIQIIC